MADTLITLDRGASGPLYRQIVERLRAAIALGTLQAGARLPSSRSLASQLGIARGTVDAAYALLVGEGVLVPRGAAGTVVSPHLPAGGGAIVRHTPTRHISHHSGFRSFRMGLPALDVFPRKLWSSLTVREARQIRSADFALPDPAGYWPLREAIANYVGIGRGIACSPDQVWVTGGFQGALSLIIGAVLHPGDAVWIEDPGYPPARNALLSAGARLLPVPIDRDGMQVEAVIERAEDARLALVSPTHQNPLGVALSLPRRLSLLAWAAQAGAWVLEDDYDSEFRYTGHPLAALKRLDHTDRVLFAGSFSKVLFPGLRLGYVVVPDLLAEDVARANSLLQTGQPVLEQRVVAAFMTEGHFARHLRRMRALYAARREALAAALTAAFGDRMQLELQSGGMHLIARFTAGLEDTELVRRAVARDLAPTALSSLFVEHPRSQGLLLSFTNIPEAEAPAMATRPAQALTVTC